MFYKLEFVANDSSGDSKETDPYKTFTNSLASPYAQCVQLILLHAGTGGWAMTFFMISWMVAFLAVTGLLWCFQGFTRGLKEGKTVGLLVQPVPDRSVVLKQNMRRIIHTSMQAQREWRSNSSNASPVTLVTYRTHGGVKYGR